MEKTIKEDLNREIVYSKLINDNTLLEYYYKNQRFYISIRFIDMGKIQEHYLKVVSIDEMEDIGNLININEDGTGIAVFNKTDEGFQLNGVYDTEEHSCENSDFMDIAYEKKFKKRLNKKLIK